MDAAATLLGDLMKKPGAVATTARARHRRYELPCAADLTELGPILRQLAQEAELAVKDKSYQQTPIGQEAKRFLDALEYDGAPKTTLDTYEHPLAKLAVDFADYEGLRSFCVPDGTSELRAFLARHWSEASLETRRNRLAVCRSFGNFAENEGFCPYNPFRKIKPPRAGETRRKARPRDETRQLLRGQESLRDSCALSLFACLAFRKNDARLLQIRDIDLTRDLVYLRHRKGSVDLQLPIEYQWLREDLYLHIQGERREPAEYLIYPRSHRHRPMDPSSIHRWFKRCLARAGVDDFELHELRHTAMDDIWRATGNIVAAQQLAGHKSLETTRRYLHPTEEDLRAAMRKVAVSWEQE